MLMPYFFWEVEVLSEHRDLCGVNPKITVSIFLTMKATLTHTLGDLLIVEVKLVNEVFNTVQLFQTFCPRVPSKHS